MIFHLLHKYKSLQKNSNQDGVSLMLAVLILAAITAISFSLTTIVFIELKASGDVVRSEPSLYATLGVTEEALFQYKRFVNERSNGQSVKPPLLDVVSCTATTTTPQAKDNVCRLGGVTLALPNGPNNDVQPLDFDTPTALRTIYSGDTLTIPLYNATSNYEAQYGRVTMQIVPANHNYDLEVNIRSVEELTGTTTFVYPVNLDLGEGDLLSLTSMATPGYQYDLIVYNVATPENFLVEFNSFDVDNSTPKGLPFLGRKVLRVVADYQGITRTYIVNVPVGGSPSGGLGVNVAAATAGATASASSTFSANFPASSAINGDRAGNGWGSGTGGWNDASGPPSWLQVDFSGTKSIGEIRVFTLPNNYPVEPDGNTLATDYGILDFQVQYWNGSSWVTVPSGSVTGNTLARRIFIFAPVQTDRIRVNVTQARAGSSRIVEVEAYE